MGIMLFNTLYSCNPHLKEKHHYPEPNRTMMAIHFTQQNTHVFISFLFSPFST